MKIWVIFLVAGIVLAGAGVYLMAGGSDAQREIRDERTVDLVGRVLYSVITTSAGRPITGNYSLTAGNMTVQILSKEGFGELTSTGSPSPGNIYFEANHTVSWSIDFMPAASGDYYLCFHSFTSVGATLSTSVSYYGPDSSGTFIGVAVIAVGVLLCLIAFVMSKQAGKIGRPG